MKQLTDLVKILAVPRAPRLVAAVGAVAARGSSSVRERQEEALKAFDANLVSVAKEVYRVSWHQIVVILPDEGEASIGLLQNALSAYVASDVVLHTVVVAATAPFGINELQALLTEVSDMSALGTTFGMPARRFAGDKRWRHSLNEDLTRALEFWRRGDGISAGRLILRNIEFYDRPGWGARVLEVCSERVGKVAPRVRHVLEVAKNRNQWQKGHRAFQEVRSIVQLRAEDGILPLAENVAKLVYNTTMPADPFDYDCGWWVVETARQMAEKEGQDFEPLLWQSLTAQLCVEKMAMRSLEAVRQEFDDEGHTAMVALLDKLAAQPWISELAFDVSMLRLWIARKGHTSPELMITYADGRNGGRPGEANLDRFDLTAFADACPSALGQSGDEAIKSLRLWVSAGNSG